MNAPAFDWKNPDYVPVFRRRVAMLAEIRADESGRLLEHLKTYYRDHPADFINDWGCTTDPRNADIDLPVMIPFLIFPKQRDWINWVLDRWHGREPGISEKSRDWGMSWLAVALADTLCLFRDDLAIGFGSRKEEYVDKIGHPKALLWKARKFIELLPVEFRGDWDSKRHSAHMKIEFPTTGSVITGEAGDNIGRGDRAAIYFVDEAAYLERPLLVEASLSQTTNCRIDISSANGLANPFAEKRHGGKISVFTGHWRDDPRKDQAWYDKQCEELDEITVAQEIDINYAASVEGVLIPSAWVQAAIGAHEKLGIVPTGPKRGAFDVADEGVDKNAFAVGQGIYVESVREWSGKGSDIFASTVKVFGYCDDEGIDEFKYDADGLGADVRGNARVINEQRVEAKRPIITVSAFRGSDAVFDPEGEDVKGRKNKDYFMNRKAQAGFALRRRFYATFRAVTQGAEVDPDFIISLNPKMTNLARLCMELSQPTYALNSIGKIVIDKTPDGMKSPNLYDSVMILYGVARRPPMVIADEAVRAV
jgi:phage terminase large subunit